MSTHQLNRILCLAEPRGDAGAVERVLQGDHRADAVALVGDLTADGSRAGHRALLRALGAGGLPTFWVPGPGDAPVAHVLREAHDTEIVHPAVRGVHGTAALGPDGHVVFAGLGGAIDDDPEAAREEVATLRYPRWEAEHRLRILEELGGQQPVLLFATPPAHKGRDLPGSEVVAELVATHRARLVVCGGEPVTELIGRTLVVAPGRLSEGRFAVADLHARDVETGVLAGVA
jgi:Icc-related predicted phosphoesterase